MRTSVLLPTIVRLTVLKTFRRILPALAFTSTQVFAMDLQLNPIHDKDTVMVSPTAQCDCQQTFIYKLTSKKHSSAGISTSSQSGRFTTEPMKAVTFSHLRLNLTQDTRYELDLIVTDLDGRIVNSLSSKYP